MDHMNFKVEKDLESGWGITEFYTLLMKRRKR